MSEPTLAEIISECNWDTRRLDAFHARAKALAESMKCDCTPIAATTTPGTFSSFAPPDFADYKICGKHQLLALLGDLKP